MEIVILLNYSRKFEFYFISDFDSVDNKPD